MRDAFRECVLDYVRDEYVAGRTPNPCVQCNRQVKFGAVPDALRGMIPDYDLLATGHYARIVHTEHGARLQRAVDRNKDQTYFLAGLPSQVLEGVHFPLGEYSKDQIKQIAADAGFSDLISGESQDFMGGGNYTLLFEEGQVVPGDIVDTAGRVLGRHSGIAHYTVGQRRGMGIAAPEPLYVCAIDAANNRVFVGGKSEVYHAAFTARGLNMFDGLGDGERVLVRVRQQHREAPATVFVEGDDILRFDLTSRNWQLLRGSWRWSTVMILSLRGHNLRGAARCVMLK